MSYFLDNYSKLSFPVGDPGYRAAQLAAVQATSAHFFSNATPAIVVMPTGSGKTVVATTLAFTLRAKRVLVITPSRLLREQIAEKFETLADLDRIHALELLTPKPRTLNLRNKIKSQAEWEELRNYDVVVATVFSISGIKNAVPPIPPDLFDVVIIDEGHHSPAATWAKALSQLEASKQILLTATPFRRDAREIKGRIVFTYDVRRAYSDGIFGDLTFRPAIPAKGQHIDVAIALEVERQFDEDRASGLEHLVMVRVDGIARGRELKKVYDKTRLRLQFISGQSALSTVRKTVQQLENGQLDGVICVNMFGEGFDMPRLKIAALHAPHKSLAVTLQFIGRFARTNDPKIGRATFVAYPNEQRAELQELWSSSAIWPDIVHNVSSLKIQQEAHAQQVFDTFEQREGPTLSDLPLNAVTPYFHAKVFRCRGEVNLDIQPKSTYESRIAFASYSRDYEALVLIRQHISKPKWISDSRIEDNNYSLDLVFYDRYNKFLFLNSTIKTISNYENIIRLVTDGKVSELSAASMNRALNDIEGLRFFNLGLRRKNFGGRTESYRTMAGPSADIAVSELDGQSYNRGHSFGKGRIDGREITIGISTSSKVWSNYVDQIPAYVQWCQELAKKLAAKTAKPTGSGIDKLSAGQPIDRFPSEPVFAFFHEKTFEHVPVCFDTGSHGTKQLGNLPDFDLHILSFENETVQFRLAGETRSWDGTFRLNDFPAVVPADESEISFHVGRNDDAISIGEYLSNYPPRFLLDNFDSVQDGALFERILGGNSFDTSDFEAVDWSTEHVNIQTEKPDGYEIKVVSIFDWMTKRLEGSNASFIFNDDGPGEVADFISLEEIEGRNVVSLYHCKASSEEKAGSRLKDLYDVCGQAIRSGIWLPSQRLVDRFEHRLANCSVEGLLRGTVEDLRNAFSAPQRHKLDFNVAIVQPGVSASKMRETSEQLLITTKHSCLAAGFDRFLIFASA